MRVDSVINHVQSIKAAAPPSNTTQLIPPWTSKFQLPVRATSVDYRDKQMHEQLRGAEEPLHIVSGWTPPKQTPATHQRTEEQRNLPVLDFIWDRGVMRLWYEQMKTGLETFWWRLVTDQPQSKSQGFYSSTTQTNEKLHTVQYKLGLSYTKTTTLMWGGWFNAAHSRAFAKKKNGRTVKDHYKSANFGFYGIFYPRMGKKYTKCHNKTNSLHHLVWFHSKWTKHHLVPAAAYI